MTKQTYEGITENNTWLEDNGCYSRYATGDEESVWVCNDCEEVIYEDADEHGEVCLGFYGS